MIKQRYESPKMVQPFLLIFENLETSCSIINSGTNAINIKNGMPYVGQEILSNTADKRVSNKYFMRSIYFFNIKTTQN